MGINMDSKLKEILEIAQRDENIRAVILYGSRADSLTQKDDYQVNVGTLGKYRKKYLSTEYYQMYEKTYIYNTITGCQKSIYWMIKLFGILARLIAKKNNYLFPKKSEDFVKKYFEYVFGEIS